MKTNKPKKTGKDERVVSVQLKLSGKLHTRVKIEAARRGCTIVKLVSDILEMEVPK